MTALIVDTSGETVQVMLVAGGGVVGQRSGPSGPGVGRDLLEKVAVLLKEGGLAISDVDRIGVVVGPGKRCSALRAGIVVAATLGYASGVAVVSLEEGGEEELVEEELVERVVGGRPVPVVRPIYQH